MRRWRVWISEEVGDQIGAAGRAAHPDETGGVLVGVQAGNRPWVTAALELPARHASPNTYSPPDGARRRAVADRRGIDSRIGYLGEWHTHPVDVGRSAVDEAAIKAMAASGDCRNPLLVVARWQGTGYAIDVWQWGGRSLRAVRVIWAGPLGPHSLAHCQAGGKP